jgi:hypothetical protein
MSREIASSTVCSCIVRGQSAERKVAESPDGEWGRERKANPKLKSKFILSKDMSQFLHHRNGQVYQHHAVSVADIFLDVYQFT